MGVLPACAGRGERRARARRAQYAREAAVPRLPVRGARYSSGFPACPNLEDQAQLLALVGADAVGIRLGDEAQLDPEQSTSALVLRHPRARYFTI